VRQVYFPAAVPAARRSSAPVQDAEVFGSAAVLSDCRGACPVPTSPPVCVLMTRRPEPRLADKRAAYRQGSANVGADRAGGKVPTRLATAGTAER
jgi:hypothetical protein